MLEEKKNNIYKLIDFLLNLEIEEKRLLDQEQINYFIDFKEIINSILDEHSLDLIIENLIKIIENITNNAEILYKNISSINRTLLENINKYEETKDINNLFFNL